MMFENQDDLKRYYSIGEVAELFDVSRSLIRYWESEFDNIRPQKNARGERRYTKANLEQIKLVYALVKERGFTIAGAKQELKERREYRRERDAVVGRLKELRGFLEKLIQQ
jgi:DNA-binding transcriptional MerR regulator